MQLAQKIHSRNLLSVVLLLAFASSCSTTSIPNPLAALKSSTSILTVETPNCSRATCRVENDAGIFFLDTSSTITITKSKSPLEVTCYVEELLPNDVLLPETIVADQNQAYVNHPFECPLTETELYVKDQIEQNYQESILEEDSLPSTIETPAVAEFEIEELIPEAPILTAAQDNAIAQLDQLLAKKMISQDTYDQEKAIVLEGSEL